MQPSIIYNMCERSRALLQPSIRPCDLARAALARAALHIQPARSRSTSHRGVEISDDRRRTRLVPAQQGTPKGTHRVLPRATHKILTGYSRGTHRVLTGYSQGLLARDTRKGYPQDTHRVLKRVLTGYSKGTHRVLPRNRAPTSAPRLGSHAGW